jgi:ABC-type Mn2+/Zn2+ transport system ATPase subunit
MMGRFGHLSWLRRAEARDREIVARSLEQMGIAHLKDLSISELSGGQQQRVFLARALAQEPHILLMDEPFTGVDTATQDATLALLDQPQMSAVTIMISTHDLNLAAARFGRVLLLNRRLLAYGPATQIFTPQVLAEAFGSQALVLPEGTVVVDHCCPPTDF